MKLLHKLSIVFFSLVLFIQMNNVATYFIVFKINQSVIASRYCEQVVRSCNGQCFLSKKLNEQNPPVAAPGTSEQKKTPVSVKTLLSEWVPDAYCWQKQLPVNLAKWVQAQSLHNSLIILDTPYNPPESFC